MRDIPVKKAAKLKSIFLMHRKGHYEVVNSMGKWGKNWKVVTDTGEYVVPDVYLLQKVTQDEMKKLI